MITVMLPKRCENGEVAMTTTPAIIPWTCLTRLSVSRYVISSTLEWTSRWKTIQIYNSVVKVHTCIDMNTAWMNSLWIVLWMYAWSAQWNEYSAYGFLCSSICIAAFASMGYFSISSKSVFPLKFDFLYKRSRTRSVVPLHTFLDRASLVCK